MTTTTDETNAPPVPSRGKAIKESLMNTADKESGSVAPAGRHPHLNRAGRPKGTLNKQTGDIKEMIRAALDEVGGQAYLARQAEANPVAFMALVAKTLPKDMTVKSNTGLDMAAAVDAFVAKLFASPSAPIA